MLIGSPAWGNFAYTIHTLSPLTRVATPDISFGSRLMSRLILLCALVLLAASPAWAVVTSITVTPANPTTCDSVTITVSGYLPDGCHHLTGATIHQDPEIPCMRMQPCPGTIHVEITETLSGTICTQAIAPYTFSFPIGLTLATDYSMDATDRVFLFDTQVEQTLVRGTFTTSFDTTSTCVPSPSPGCYILGFHDPRDPRRMDPPPGTFCDASTVPGGTACLPVDLMNTIPVGGLQMTVPIPASGVDNGITVASAEAVGRAAGFQVSWSNTTDGPKFILYSTTGETIPAGDGPVMRICFTMHAPPGSYEFHDEQTVVADAAGNAVFPCPTFARIAPGVICVASVACDLNLDGVSDVLDIIHLVQCALSAPGDSSLACPDPVRGRADCNNDGLVDIRDVICCVRKILSLDTKAIGLPPSIQSSGNDIRFEGPITWTSDTDGTATLLLDAASGWGGVQFTVDSRRSPVRVTGMTLDAAPAQNAQLESFIDDTGLARGMIFANATGPRSALTVRVRLALVREASASGSDPLRLGDLRAGDSMGTPAEIASSRPTLDLAGAPGVPTLDRANPNPFAGTTEISFTLPAQASAALSVYDVNGRLVRTLKRETLPAGLHRVEWNGLDDRGHKARSGIYFLKLEVGSVTRTDRILLVR